MIDLTELWNFDDPAGSEQRLRAAQVEAPETEAAVLQTQVEQLSQAVLTALVEVESAIVRDGKKWSWCIRRFSVCAGRRGTAP